MHLLSVSPSGQPPSADVAVQLSPQLPLEVPVLADEKDEARQCYGGGEGSCRNVYTSLILSGGQK